MYFKVVQGEMGDYGERGWTEMPKFTNAEFQAAFQGSTSTNPKMYKKNWAL